MEYLAAVPSVWDETRALDGKIGEYVLVARRNGNEWYIGAMTNWTAREVDLDLSFLPAGKWNMTAYEDGVNAAAAASDYKKVTKGVDNSTKLKLRLAPGGGWAARITR
jgi:alpha-glucosidase